ncbi:hypothetical protein T08_223 [Trichinella sp. T8]|nr:hypothetical protein T08_223 [Trichinella sp. T8]
MGGGGIRFPDPFCEYHGIYFLVTMKNVKTNEQVVMIYRGKKLNMTMKYSKQWRKMKMKTPNMSDKPNEGLSHSCLKVGLK